MLAYPIVLIQWIGSTALPGAYLMLFAVTLFLKLTSFHHVCYDNRYLLKRVQLAKKSSDKQQQQNTVEDLATLFNVNQRTFAISMEYPQNLRLLHYLRFLAAPTCCY